MMFPINVPSKNVITAFIIFSTIALCKRLDAFLVKLKNRQAVTIDKTVVATVNEENSIKMKEWSSDNSTYFVVLVKLSASSWVKFSSRSTLRIK